MGNKVFEAKGVLGEQAEVYDAEMTGLCMAVEATKQFVLDGDWTEGPETIPDLQKTHQRNPRRSKRRADSH